MLKSLAATAFVITIAIAPFGQTDFRSNIAELTFAELPHLRESITLRSWRTLHPSDRVESSLKEDGSGGFDKWCARAVAEPIDHERSAKRVAYFYPPPPPDPALLPIPDEPRRLIEQCSLGALTVEQEVDAADADTVRDRVRRTLNDEFGPGTFGVRLHWADRGSPATTGVWKPQGVTVASTLILPDANAAATRQRGRSLVVAVNRSSGVVLDDSIVPAEQRAADTAHARRVNARVREAIRIAAVGGEAERGIRASLAIIAAAAPPLRFPTTTQRMRIVHAIAGWLKAATTLPASRRAAALLVADSLVEQSGAAFLNEKKPSLTRRILQSRGATFEWSELDGGFSYAHDWLKEALRLDAYGPAGELAFLSLMEKGFETSFACGDQGGEGFLTVIDRGQKYLQSSHATERLAYVHLLVARAYADVVLLEADRAYGVEIQDYYPQPAVAHRNALDHYQAALNMPLDSSAAREAWSEAWRLSAGMMPLRTYFYCLYD